jgi:hypothetical protein
MPVLYREAPHGRDLPYTYKGEFAMVHVTERAKLYLERVAELALLKLKELCGNPPYGLKHY